MTKTNYRKVINASLIIGIFMGIFIGRGGMYIGRLMLGETLAGSLLGLGISFVEGFIVYLIFKFIMRRRLEE